MLWPSQCLLRCRLPSPPAPSTPRADWRNRASSASVPPASTSAARSPSSASTRWGGIHYLEFYGENSHGCLTCWSLLSSNCVCSSRQELLRRRVWMCGGWWREDLLVSQSWSQILDSCTRGPCSRDWHAVTLWHSWGESHSETPWSSRWLSPPVGYVSWNVL